MHHLLAGKAAIADNPGREASEAFKQLTSDQKQQLAQEIEREATSRRLTKKEALNRGAKIYLNWYKIW